MSNKKRRKNPLLIGLGAGAIATAGGLAVRGYLRRRGAKSIPVASHVRQATQAANRTTKEADKVLLALPPAELVKKNKRLEVLKNPKLQKEIKQIQKLRQKLIAQKRMLQKNPLRSYAKNVEKTKLTLKSKVAAVKQKLDLLKNIGAYTFLGDIAEFKLGAVSAVRVAKPASRSFVGTARGTRRQIPALRTGAFFPALTPTQKALKRVAVQTARQGKIPTRRFLAKEAKVIGKDFIKNPIQNTLKGARRERMTRGIVKAITGKTIPSRRRMLGQGVTKTVKSLNTPANRENLAVNTMGFLGSVGGGAIGGFPGKIAGDLVGAVAARKAITDAKATHKTIKSLSNRSAFRQANPLQKARMIQRGSMGRLRGMRPSILDNKIDDTAGWAVGNTVAESLDPVLGAPFKGMGAALAVGPTLNKHTKRAMAGTPLGQVVRDAARDVRGLPKKWWQQGNRREAAMRQRLNSAIPGAAMRRRLNSAIPSALRR